MTGRFGSTNPDEKPSTVTTGLTHTGNGVPITTDAEETLAALRNPLLGVGEEGQSNVLAGWYSANASYIKLKNGEKIYGMKLGGRFFYADKDSLSDEAKGLLAKLVTQKVAYYESADAA